MSVEVLVLGLVSGLRPATAQAAVFALLRAPSPARNLLAFAVTGFAFSMAIGLLCVVAFDGAGGAFGRSTFTELFDLLVGIAALGFAAGIQRGGLDRRRERPPRQRTTNGITARLQRPSLLTAAAAGPATHLPGLIYLAALNSIAAGRPGVVEASVDVAVYNLLWFAVPLAALTLALRSPETATRYLDRLSAWARAHQDRLLVAVFGALGVYLVAKGVVGLAS